MAKNLLSRFGWLWVSLALLLAWLPNIAAGSARQQPALPAAPPAGPSAIVPNLDILYLPVNDIKPAAPGYLRIGVMSPEAEPAADILFVHGHADRLDNHGPLFSAWREAGFRVLSFDLPSHGESNILPIDLYSFEDLVALMRLLDEATLEDPDRPLFVAGWSFGGLVVTRMAQQPDLFNALSRTPQGLILFAPAVTPYPMAGGDGVARVSTLTNNPHPPVAGPPSPTMPIQNPIFASRLLAEAWQAEQTLFPPQLPVLLIAAGETEDWYVNAAGVLAWAHKQAQGGAVIRTFQCPAARHALDNEPYPIGSTVRQLAADFVAAVLQGTPLEEIGPTGPEPQACILQGQE